jgi:excisionase family DNA binding protein
VSELADRLDRARGRLRDQAPAEHREPFFTPNSLAALLDVSERTVRYWISDGTIPSYKFGRIRRINQTDVDAFLARHRQERR